MSRRPGQSALASRRHAHLTQATAADTLNHFELWTVLECHAVYQAALAAHRDLRSVRAVFPDFNRRVLAPADPCLSMSRPIHRPAVTPDL